MDNLTHSLAGALLGQCGLKRKTGLAMPALIIGANLPDVDAACFLWLEGHEHLGFRRGITHGPPAWLLLPLALAGLLWAYDRWQVKRGTRPEGRLPVNFKWLYLLSLIGCLTHPALDWMNVYGVRLLEPFSSRWFYGDVLFIIDIWLWALLIGSVWFSLRREKRGGEWMKPARVALVAMLAYIGLNAGITWNAERQAAGEGEVVIASPEPLTFWTREMIVGGNGRYTVGGERRGDFDLTDADKPDIVAAVPQAGPFLFWSRTPLVHVADDGRYLLTDARYLARGEGTFTLELPAEVCEPQPLAPEPDGG
ncbi:metal-dependent hydrolase [Alteraurantiacibacter aquimixticola]|uniref:Metal-dependent hydrolase n=1 Tax=Alteraurantiacibacter aquimixticola TaxID=2489173 RepID=A0A4T3EZZ1_9SPHN|nr:metal-dependent hydrolase [Alteraurantiacibacter aquimixticola]TIX50224.1 metal-dependent hydrolase [Alteraurantiacibacter aquimixticola]